MSDGFGDLSIWDLFRMEVESKTAALTDGLLVLERSDNNATLLEDLMRAAHSLKGAAQMVDARPAVRVAHAMEDCFVSMQNGATDPDPPHVDALLEGVDLLRRIAMTESTDTVALDALDDNTTAFIERLMRVDAGAAKPNTDAGDVAPHHATPRGAVPRETTTTRDTATIADNGSRDDDSLRVTADRMNRLLSLAAESLVTTRWLDEFVADAARARQQHREVSDSLERFREALAGDHANADLLERLADTQRHVGELRRFRTSEIAELVEIQRRASSVANQLYRDVVDLRMRPFAEGVAHLGRLVRTLSRQLGKDARLDIQGGTTPVDREILERLDASFVNLIRNAVDHGIEPPEERILNGKQPTGTIVLRASHRAGMLFITAEDDGRGVDLGALRNIVVQRGHTTRELAAQMSDAEILDFLFLPGFSMRDTVSETSGRGVGMDIIQTAARDAGGKVTLHTRAGNGLQFDFQLPLTLSVVRALVFEVGGEPYAVPIARVARVMKAAESDIASLEGRQHVAIDADRIGLVAAHQVLGVSPGAREPGDVPIIVLGQGARRYAVQVERLLGERELVVRALDPHLGKVKDISSAALLPDGTPLLIIDVEDVLHSIEHLITGGRVEPAAVPQGKAAVKQKRILVVDDSFTVRELERKLLAGRGYAVDVAVDGVDGWNAARTGKYDLVVTDVDMPRMNGIELVTKIRQDPRLHLLPIIIVSYKEREEDRMRGMEAGADRYLTKGSYHDDSLVNAIVEHIGAPGDA